MIEFEIDGVDGLLGGKVDSSGELGMLIDDIDNVFEEILFVVENLIELADADHSVLALVDEDKLLLFHFLFVHLKIVLKVLIESVVHSSR